MSVKSSPAPPPIKRSASLGMAFFERSASPGPARFCRLTGGLGKVLPAGGPGQSKTGKRFARKYSLETSRRREAKRFAALQGHSGFMGNPSGSGGGSASLTRAFSERSASVPEPHGNPPARWRKSSAPPGSASGKKKGSGAPFLGLGKGRLSCAGPAPRRSPDRWPGSGPAVRPWRPRAVPVRR